MPTQREVFWRHVRDNVVGRDAATRTPFGRRRILYADYTASGRAVDFIESYLHRVLAEYANTHTEDDATGRATTERLARAERTIKRLLNAGDEYALIATGAGTTAAVERLQQILGVYVAPATRDRQRREQVAYLGAAGAGALDTATRAHRPVVFVGPYEHHSNELSWREADAVVVEVDLDARGLLDLEDLERKVSDPGYRDRVRIGAFSGASNVTGVLTPVHEVARVLRRHGCLAVFDLAAVAPYRAIDVRPDPETRLDAVYFSPHKLVGGPGACGVLLIRRDLYRSDLPPTFAGGGTVDFVNWSTQDYAADLETREKAGTPAILQTLRAALAMELMEKLGYEEIERRERWMTTVAMERLTSVEEIEVVGSRDPGHRVGIVSFVVRMGRSWIHPRLVTQLLNDLFGVQSRAGCLCAGPYGHRLLGIDTARSEAFREAIRAGRSGLKPGWTRVSFHYLHTDEELDFLCDAIAFVAREARLFLPLYDFDVSTGAWSHRGTTPTPTVFGLDEALAPSSPADAGAAPGPAACVEEAWALATKLRAGFDPGALRTTDPALVPFAYVHTAAPGSV